MKIKERAAMLKRDVPAVFLALKDGRTPVIAKILAGITVAYALSPVDLIPGFCPGIGVSGRCASAAGADCPDGEADPGGGSGGLPQTI